MKSKKSTVKVTCCVFLTITLLVYATQVTIINNKWFKYFIGCLVVDNHSNSVFLSLVFHSKKQVQFLVLLHLYLPILLHLPSNVFTLIENP